MINGGTTIHNSYNRPQPVEYTLSAIRTIKTGALSLIRRGRHVAWCPDWMNLGNLLYVGNWAHEGWMSGEPRFALLRPSKRSALRSFPRLLDKVFIAKSDVRFLDRREMPWSGEGDLRDAHYDPPNLSSYISDLLLPDSPIATRPRDIHDDALVLNVRRGDYFSVPEHKSAFGINTTSYSIEAVAAAVEEGDSPSEIIVVSDDIGWCQDHLQALTEFAPVRLRDGGVVDDLAALVHAPRLVIPNSTFSYWGGYIGDVANPGRQVVAPGFFTRTTNNGRAWQLRPEWRVVENIPGGWSEPAA